MATQKERTSKIAIIKNGKDICRLIFRRCENGLYDLKFECLGNEYVVQQYHIFREVPEVVEINNSANFSISYHPGYNSEPIRIHLKKERVTDGENRYENLLISNLLPPNVNQIFPVPLLKIEVSDCMLAETKDYVHKSHHECLDIGEANVIELFIASDNFTKSDFFKKYQRLIMPYFMLSFEYLSSYSVSSDYQKYSNYVPRQGEEERLKVIHPAEGMELCVSLFCDHQYTASRDKMTLTFIENKYAEDILLNTLIKHDKQGLLLGAAALDNLSMPPVSHPTVLKSSIVEECLLDNRLSDNEKGELAKKAISARFRLSQALFSYNNEYMDKKNRLEAKAKKFLAIIDALHIQASNNFYMKNRNADAITDIERWHLLSPDLHAQEIHMLFAKFMGKESCYILRHVIYSSKYRELTDEAHERILRHCPEKMYKDIPLPHVKYKHDWLKYDDMCEVDLLKPYLAKFLCNKDENLKELVSRSVQHFCNEKWNELVPKLKKQGYICDNITGGYIDVVMFDGIFKSRNGLLSRVYDDVVAHW